MRNNRLRLSGKRGLNYSLWVLLGLSLVLSACSGNKVQNENTDSEVDQPKSILTLPEEVVQVGDLNQGVVRISTELQEEQVNWENLPMTQYTVALVDAAPFMNGQSDLSALKVFEKIDLSKDGSISFDLPQQPLDAEPMQAMLLLVENRDCLIAGNQFSSCWDAELSSVAFEDLSQSSIVDGTVLVWATDDQQSFPQSTGADGKYFTDDDELAALAQGYTLVDLSSTPFTFAQPEQGELALFSNYDPAIRDLSELTYSEAFNHIFADMKEVYAFNGFEGKEPDWEYVYNLIHPQVMAAEESGDVKDWVSALNAFSQEFSDSRVSISGEVVDTWLEEKYAKGFIYYFDLLSNGDIVATRGTTSYVEEARLDYFDFGYTLAEINGIPIEEEIKNITPIFGSYSNPDMYYRAQVHDITHIYAENEPEFGLSDSYGNIAIENYKYSDSYSLSAEEDYFFNFSKEQPVTGFRSINGVGMIRIHSDGYDAQLTMDLFEKMLSGLSAQHVDKILIDLRDSEEDQFMNYAGYFSNEAIELGEMQWQQFGVAEGKLRSQSFVSYPQTKHYSFDEIAVLSGERCKNACEADVLALGLLPEVVLYGETSTFGSLSIAESQPYILPDEISFNFSSGLFYGIENELLIEGKGVAMDVPVEERISTYLSVDDWRLTLIMNLLEFEDEMNIKPEKAVQVKTFTEDELNEWIDEFDQRDLEYLAADAYPALYQDYDYTYQVFISDPGVLFLSNKWCTDESDSNLYNAEDMNLEFIVDGNKIDDELLHTRIIDQGSYECWVRLAVLDDWSEGSHSLTINTEIPDEVSDGGAHFYNPGTYSEEYTVIVKKSK